MTRLSIALVLGLLLLPAVSPVVLGADVQVATASQAEVQRAQQMLNALAYDAGSADGMMGSRTRNAIRMFQADKGMVMTGEVTASLLTALDAEVAKRGATVTPTTTTTNTATAPAAGGDAALIEKLRALIDEGERARAADGWFLDKLRALVAANDWPWNHRVLGLDLRDGAAVEQAGLRIDAGRFSVDRYAGLVGEPVAQSTASSGGSGSGEELAAAILGALLQGNNGNSSNANSGTGKSVLAQVHLAAAITNAFVMAANVSATRATGPLSLGVFRDQLDSLGYRLVVQPGAGAQLAIVRVQGDGSLAMVGGAPWSGNLADGRVHALQWTRGDQGRMTVSVDGQLVLDVSDRNVGSGFQGVILKNQGGDWALRDLTIDDQG